MSNVDIGDIAKRLEASAPASKKARISEPQREVAPDLFLTLAQTLHGLRQKVLEMKLSPTTVEIEFRVGMLVTGRRRWQSSKAAGGCISLQQETAKKHGVEFVSGMDETAVERLKLLLQGGGFTSSSSEQRVRTGNSSGLRCVVDSQGREVMSERKNKLLRLDLACLGHQYDGRLEVATEVTSSEEGDSSKRNGLSTWTVERLKRRTTFRRISVPGKGPESAWQVDLTDVTTTQLVGAKTGGSIQSTELEFEIVPEALKNWLQCVEEGAAVQLTNQLATELRELLNTCVVMTSEEGAETGASSSRITPMPRNASLLTEIKKLNSTIIGSAGISFSCDDFLGSMPLNISRRNLLRLEREEYFVTEKSDGVRYLMYVLPTGVSKTGIAIFVDRAGNCFRPPGAEAIAAGLKPGTVLDGEIVFNLHFKKHLFLVFDVLCNEGRPCAQDAFEVRNNLISTVIKQKCESIEYTAAERPLWIIRKKFWRKTELKQLLKLMVSRKGSRIYEESKQRNHKSDGLIFQPNSPYVFGTDVNLVKWKWPELASVDLQVVANARKDVTDEPSLMAGGPDHTLVDCCMRGRSHVGLGTFDTFRLLADVGDSISRTAHIAEVAFCPGVGLWSYFQLRGDKVAPNYINTVLSILMEQAEDIGLEELLQRLLPTTSVS